MTPKTPKPEDVKKFIIYKASIADLKLSDRISMFPLFLALLKRILELFKVNLC